MYFLGCIVAEFFYGFVAVDAAGEVTGLGNVSREKKRRNGINYSGIFFFLFCYFYSNEVCF